MQGGGVCQLLGEVSILCMFCEKLPPPPLLPQCIKTRLATNSEKHPPPCMFAPFPLTCIGHCVFVHVTTTKTHSNARMLFFFATHDDSTSHPCELPRSTIATNRASCHLLRSLATAKRTATRLRHKPFDSSAVYRQRLGSTVPITCCSQSRADSQI